MKNLQLLKNFILNKEKQHGYRLNMERKRFNKLLFLCGAGKKRAREERTASSSSYKKQRPTLMPLLSYGTVQGDRTTFKKRLKHALTTGFRHIDLKQRYSSMLNMTTKNYLRETMAAIEECGLRREDVWITWLGNLKIALKYLTYVDTFLGPHSKKAADDKSIVRTVGIENVYDFDKIQRINNTMPITVLQIQGRVQAHHLIQQCQAHGIRVQVYGLFSALINMMVYSPHHFDVVSALLNGPNLIGYYRRKFPNSVLIVGSARGTSIERNFHQQDIDDEEFNTIDGMMRQLGELPSMGPGWQ